MYAVNSTQERADSLIMHVCPQFTYEYNAQTPCKLNIILDTVNSSLYGGFMARRKRSTRTGQYRKTARRAYTGLKTRARRARSYVRRRRGRITVGRKKNGAMIKTRSMRALKECAWITGGSAAAMTVTKFVPGSYMGISTPTLLGVGAVAWGIYKNDDKPIYLGFGALYPDIYRKMADLIKP